ncbi:MAG: 2OG-Fe(II) oxygenase [Steroidobacteraceae bacterium]|jgi:prolyl 4-hydroxylase|nr:2OG-Fe(II) oxygenase [Steroidobacteraceae bacterium]
MTTIERPGRFIEPSLRDWMIERARAGAQPEELLRPLRERGWGEDEAVDAIDAAMREYLDAHARQHGLPPVARVPSPILPNGSSVLDAGDREVHVVASLRLPRIVVFAGLLSAAECEALVALARPRLARSTVVDGDTGGEAVHAARTSETGAFQRGEHPLVATIERRIAVLLDWPLENGEGMQVLRYGPGAEYRPHHDWFDPQQPGAAPLLQLGGQRVATVVMYLNTPARGGATVFPDGGFEAAAVRGNAVFFSYDRPHAMTRTLHAGAPVVEGEKWIATKWLRERRHG